MKNVLLVMLEFDNWNQARAWSYTGAWAFQDGLEENGHHCTVLPAMWGRAPDAADSFIHHAEKLLAGQTFDEAWVWCVHTQFDARFWQWLARVAPKRIGITMESLGVNAAESAEFPHFAQRQEEVLAQLAHCTHAIVADEADIDLVQQRLGIPASWNVVMVPERFVRFDAAPECPQAAFIGNKYGERRPYLEDPALAELLCRPHLPERESDLPQRFDALHQEIRRLLLAGQFDHAVLQRATLQMKLVREALFRLHLDGIRLGFANINLPSMIKAYAGRVTESMAAAAPAVSWLPPDRPACARLFKAGTEIELFSSPAELHALLTRQAPDSAQRNRQVTAARNTLLNRHTTRIRLRQYQNWLDQGIAPDFFSDIGYKPSVEESQYYKHFFAEDPHWSRPTPNGDERARWEKIQAMVARVREAQGEPLRIVEVGCGRGWLSKLLSEYGAVLGSEPVGDVINHAKGMFPEQEFFTGSAELLQFIGLKEFFDLLVCSEVIEHVPYAYKEGFVAGLTGLVRPGGYLILTTPRADIYPEWSEKYGKPPQPTEDWLTEAQLKALLEGAGCEALELQRAFLMDIYQIWLFRRKPARHASEDVHGVAADTPAIQLEICIPTWNRAEKLANTLARIAPLAEKHLLVVRVSDNGSTDDTPAVLARYAGCAWLRTQRHDQNLGFDANIASLIAAATGDYLMFQGDDDEIVAEGLSELLERLATRPAGVWTNIAHAGGGSVAQQLGLLNEPRSRFESLVQRFGLLGSIGGLAHTVCPRAALQAAQSMAYAGSNYYHVFCFAQALAGQTLELQHTPLTRVFPRSEAETTLYIERWAMTNAGPWDFAVMRQAALFAAWLAVPANAATAPGCFRMYCGMHYPYQLLCLKALANLLFSGQAVAESSLAAVQTLCQALPQPLFGELCAQAIAIAAHKDEAAIAAWWQGYRVAGQSDWMKP